MTKRLSASSAARIMACPASANLDVAIPGWKEPVRTVGGAAQAGTDVHQVIQDLIGIKYETLTKTTKFSAKDMLAVARILQYIGELWSTRRFSVLSEETVEAHWLQTKPKTTGDLVFYTQDEIHVLDTKWGKIPVDVNDNEQLMFYALAYAGLAPRAKGVTVHILQPRADNMDSQFLPTTKLAQFKADTIAAEAKILAKDLTFGPSDHCTFCPANPHSRGVKGSPLCPTVLNIHYPKLVDEDEILNL